MRGHGLEVTWDEEQTNSAVKKSATDSMMDISTRT